MWRINKHPTVKLTAWITNKSFMMIRFFGLNWINIWNTLVLKVYNIRHTSLSMHRTTQCLNISNELKQKGNRNWAFASLTTFTCSLTEFSITYNCFYSMNMYDIECNFLVFPLTLSLYWSKYTQNTFSFVSFHFFSTSLSCSKFINGMW